MQAELTVEEADFVIVAGGDTYPIREVLKSLGFSWNARHKVWFHVGDFTDFQSEYFGRLAQATAEVGVFFRYYSHWEKAWHENR